MRILQLTPRVPWPPDDGGRVVMLQSARALTALGAEVHVLSLNPDKHRSDPGRAKAALAPIPFDAVDIDTTPGLRTSAVAIRRRIPWLVARFVSRSFDRALRSALRNGRFDIVQIESPFLLPYLDTIRAESNAVVVLRSLNVEFHIWEQLAQNERRPWMRLATRRIARAIRRWEVAQLNSCDALVAITESDAHDFVALGCTRPVFVAPGGVERVEGLTSADPGTFYFLGSLDYRPNQEAAVWIARELRPRLEARHCPAILHVAGSRPPHFISTVLESAGIPLYADVPDAAAFARPMSSMIVPLFSGSGMRLKIVEAMALGKAVIATPLAAAGLEVEDGKHIILADDADTFAAAVESLTANPSLAEAIGDRARTLVGERYLASDIARTLLSFYEELTHGRRVR